MKHPISRRQSRHLIKFLTSSDQLVSSKFSGLPTRAAISFVQGLGPRSDLPSTHILCFDAQKEFPQIWQTRPSAKAAAQVGLALTLAACLLENPSQAQNATWLDNPPTAVFDEAGNWSTNSVPTGTASFGESNKIDLTFNPNMSRTVNGITLNADAEDYQLLIGSTSGLTFEGDGIKINGGSLHLISEGSLVFKNSSTAGNSTITVNSNNINGLVFDNSSSAGNANITSFGKVSFNGNSTAGNATIVSNPTMTGGFAELGFFGNSSAKNAKITNNHTTTFYQSSSAGNSEIINHETLAFSGNSTAGNSKITNNKTLTFYENATAGNASLINNGGTIDFSQTTGQADDSRISAGSIAGNGAFLIGANELTVGSNDMSTEVSGVISGEGSLVKVGSGTLTLWGANTYEGGTTISDGTLQIGIGGTTGSVQGNIVNNGSLIFNRSSALTYGGDISGTGGLTKLGLSNLILTGSHTFAGDTVLNLGGIVNNGQLASRVVVNAGLYTGTGSAGGLVVNSNGAVSPGNASQVGTMNIAGDVAFNDGSTLLVKAQVNGDSNLLSASGQTEISSNGTTIRVDHVPGAFPVSQTYTIITSAGGVRGEFGAVIDDLPDLDFEPIYGPNDVQLRYTIAQEPSPMDPGNSVGMPGTGQQPPRTFSRKEVHPSAQAAAMDSALLFAQTLRRRGGLYAGFGGNSSASTADLLLPASGPYEDDQVVGLAPHDWAIWGAGMGRLTNVDGSAGISGYDVRVGGAAVGVEHHFDALQARLGLAGGYTTTDVDNGPSDADVETWHIGAYGNAAVGSLILSGAVAYAWQDYDFDRQLPFGGGAVTAYGSSDGTALTASGEAFYDLAYPLGMSDLGGTASAGGLRFGPLATIDAVQATRDGFTETGAGILNLTVGRETASQAITGLGLAVGADQMFGSMRVSADARVTWEHVFGATAVIATSAIPIASATFIASSADTGRDRLAVGLGAALDVSDRISAHIRYDAFFSETTDDHSGSAGLSFKF